MSIQGFEKRGVVVRGIVVLCCVLFASGDAMLVAQAPAAQAAAPKAGSTETVQKLNNDQLDSLVAPVALYPDPLLSQALVASTYPAQLGAMDFLGSR